MAEYKLVENGVVRSDGASIPNSEDNRDWQRYLDWLAAGNTPDPADPPTPSPAPENTPLTNEDIERLLIDTGLATRGQINTAKRGRGTSIP